MDRAVLNWKLLGRQTGAQYAKGKSPPNWGQLHSCPVQSGGIPTSVSAVPAGTGKRAESSKPMRESQQVALPFRMRTSPPRMAKAYRTCVPQNLLALHLEFQDSETATTMKLRTRYVQLLAYAATSRNLCGILTIRDINSMLVTGRR